MAKATVDVWVQDAMDKHYQFEGAPTVTLTASGANDHQIKQEIFRKLKIYCHQNKIDRCYISVLGEVDDGKQGYIDSITAYFDYGTFWLPYTLF